MWEDFFLNKILQKAAQNPTKVRLFHKKKQVGEIMIMNDIEWSMLSYYVIYYENFKKKVMQRTEKEALNTY